MQSKRWERTHWKTSPDATYSLTFATDLRKAGFEVREVSLSLPCGLLSLLFRKSLCEPSFYLVESADGALVGSFARLACEVGGYDQVNFFLHVVEGQDLIEEHQAGVGNAELVFGDRGQLLDLSDDVVGEEAYCSGGEGRQAGESSGGVSAEGFLQLLEDVSGEGAAFFAFLHGDVAVRARPSSCRAGCR